MPHIGDRLRWRALRLRSCPLFDSPQALAIRRDARRPDPLPPGHGKAAIDCRQADRRSRITDSGGDRAGFDKVSTFHGYLVWLSLFDEKDFGEHTAAEIYFGTMFHPSTATVGVAAGASSEGQRAVSVRVSPGSSDT